MTSDAKDMFGGFTCMLNPQGEQIGFRPDDEYNAVKASGLLPDATPTLINWPPLIPEWVQQARAEASEQ